MNTKQILTITAFSTALRQGFEFIERDIAQTERDLFRTSDTHALPLLKYLHKVAGFNQGGVCSSIQPSKPTAKNFDEQVASLHVGPVHICYLDLAAWRWFEIGCNTQHVVVIEIETRDGDVGFGVGRLFFNRNSPPRVVEFDDAILLRRGDRVAEHGSASWSRGRARKLVGKSVAVKNIIAEHQCNTVRTDEVGAEHERIGETTRILLGEIRKAKAEVGSVA